MAHIWRPYIRSQDVTLGGITEVLASSLFWVRGIWGPLKESIADNYELFLN